MSILQEILGWTQGVPAWQSDAAARLLAKQTLNADDLDDLYALLKWHTASLTLKTAHQSPSRPTRYLRQ